MYKRQALIGGETAEMPGFYSPGEYDLAGFCVGIVEKSLILDGSQVKVGDIAIGLESSGIHSNGFSLVRKIIDKCNISLEDSPDFLEQKSLGEALLTPTKIYVKSILAAQKSGLEIHGMAHITGGGLPENLPRCLPPEMSIDIDRNSWKIPPIFRWLAEVGNVDEEVMFNTFNMGIGFVVLVSPNQVETAINLFASQQIKAYCLGEVN